MSAMLLLLLAASACAAAAHQQEPITLVDTSVTGTAGSSNARLHGSNINVVLRLVVLVLLPSSNSPALDLMGVASHLQARGHTVLVVTTSPAAHGYLKRAAARHTSNTTAEAMQYNTAAASPSLQYVGPAAAPAAPAAGQQTGQQHQHHQQQQQQVHASQPAAAGHKQQTWRVPHTWWGRALIGPQLVLAMQDSMAGACSQVVRDAATMQRVRDFRPDAILPVVLLPTGPSLAPDSCGCILSQALGGVPYVEVDAALATFWVSPINNPQFGSGVTPADLQNPLQHPVPWLRNAATWLTLQLLPLWQAVRPGQSPAQLQSYSALRSQLSLPPAATYSSLGYLLQLVRGRRAAQRCQPLLRVLPGTWLLEHPCPLEPTHVLTGAGSPRRGHTLVSPADAAEFVRDATHGLILVGFGTGKIANDSSWLRLLDFQELAKGFAALAPVRVLWNLQGGVPGGAEGVQLGSNTLVVGWIDYNDVLGHPNTRAFLTHCGLHSVHEALFHGVPLIGVPFMFEQVHTCEKAVRVGVAAISPQAPAFRSGPLQGMTFTAEGVAGSIREVLHNSSLAEAAAGVSRALQQYASRRHPYARAADAVEVAVVADRLDREQKQLKQQQQQQQQREVLLADVAKGDDASGSDDAGPAESRVGELEDRSEL